MLQYNSIPNCPNDLKLTGCTRGGVRIIPTKFEVIPKKFNFLWNIGILGNFSFRPVISTFMVLKCLKFIRKTVIVQNHYGIGMIRLYTAHKVMI